MTPASVVKNIARMDVIAVLLLVAGCLLDQALLVGRGIENPWISMTGPWCPSHTVNPLLGYAWFGLSGDLLHNENLSIFSDQAMLAGRNLNTAFYALRPGVGLSSFVLFWLDSANAAAATVTALSLLAVVSTYGLARSSGVRSGHALVLAALAYTLGCISFHVKDFSAHIGGSALWLLATVAVLRIGPWRAHTTIPELVFLHALMITALLFYWSNVVLYLAFVLMLAPHWRRFGVSFAVFLAAYQLRAAWAWWMNFAYHGHMVYGETEQIYLNFALGRWRDTYATEGGLGVLAKAGRLALEGLMSEPQSLLCGLFVGLLLLLEYCRQGPPVWFLRDRRVQFALLATLGSCALLIVWGTAAYARGYLSYGIPLGILTIVSIVLGRGEQRLRRAPWISVTLLALLAWQIVWIKSPLFGNPFAHCQYLLAPYADLSVFSEFIARFRHPLTFIALSEPLQLQNISELAATIRAALSTPGSVIPTEAIGVVGATPDFRRSLLLCSFLFAAPTVVALYGARLAARWSAARATTVALSAALVWWIVAWLVTPVSKGAGATVQRLYTPCALKQNTVRYRLVLPKGALDYLRHEGVDRVEITSGWRRNNEAALKSLTILKENGVAAEAIHSRRGDLALTELARLQPTSTDLSPLVIVEEYSTPPQNYVGWQRAVPGSDADGRSGCGVDLQASLEIRALRPRDPTPTIFFY